MAKVRNISGEPLAVPEINRVVDADEVVDVPDERVEAFTCQPTTWAAESARKKD